MQRHLVTASDDGLACLYDCSMSDEDESIQTIINAESSIKEIGFFGPEKKGLFCLTGTETLDIWNLETSERYHHHSNIRGVASKMNVRNCRPLICSSF